MSLIITKCKHNNGGTLLVLSHTLFVSLSIKIINGNLFLDSDCLLIKDEYEIDN